MPMLRTRLLLVLTPLLILLSREPVFSQTPPGAGYPDPSLTGETALPTVQMTYDEVYQLLLSRGLTEEATNELLRDYDPDRTFTTREVNDILRRVRQEDLITRRKT